MQIATSLGFNDRKSFIHDSPVINIYAFIMYSYDNVIERLYRTCNVSVRERIPALYYGAQQCESFANDKNKKHSEEYWQ